jgi:hypothetical protein
MEALAGDSLAIGSNVSDAFAQIGKGGRAVFIE